MNMTNHRYLLLTLVSCLLVACGGGGGGGGAVTSLNGTVAIGAPLAGAVVTATDVNGTTSSSVIADDEGNYQNLDISKLSTPFLIEAVGQLGQTPYKLSAPIAEASSATANVTTLTTTLSALIAGGDPDTIVISSITPTSVATATQTLTSVISPVMQTVGVSSTNFNPITSAQQILSGVSSNFNPVTAAFKADSTGQDKLLDALDIRHRSTGTYISNRLEAVTEGNTDADLSEVEISNGHAGGALPAGTDRDVAGLKEIARQLTACFAIPAAQRVTSTPDVFGIPIPISTHASCQTFLDSDYQQNTYSFAQRWINILQDPAFDGAKFQIQLRYVVSSAFPSISKDAYVTNLYFKDSIGNGYTRPEVAILNNNTYKLYGNHRVLDAGSEPVITKITDFTNTTTSTGNRIEGRLRFWMTPNRAWDSGTSAYKFFYNNSNKPDPVLPCAWVTGPGLPGNGAMNSANTGPLGGILLKVPRSDYVARQDYLAVHVKFPATFDPFGVDADRQSLMKACAARENTGTIQTPVMEVATWSTNNQFTIDAAKDSTSSGFIWPPLANGNQAYSWAGSSTTYSAMVGTKYGTYALSTVDATTKASYKPTTMPTYTFFAFPRTSLSAVTYASSPNAAVPVITLSDANTFWATKIQTKARMIGAMPYLTIDSNGIYKGKDAFSTVTSASAFLSASATTLAANSTLDTTWTVPAKASGVDRVGYSCWANWMNSSNEVRWGPSVSSNSWGVPRNINSKSFTLEEDCVGYEWGQNNTPTVSSLYREIWARSYDAENRQIQSVQYARR